MTGRSGNLPPITGLKGPEREGAMSLLFEILIGAIVVAAVANLLIGVLPRRDKIEPADTEKR